MFVVLFAVLGTLAGAFCVFLLTEKQRRRMAALKIQLDENAVKLRDGWRAFKEKQQQILETINSRQRQVDQKSEQVKKLESDLRARFVSYEELQTENTVLKRDLQNVSIELRKLTLDRERWSETHGQFQTRICDLGQRYLRESYKWVESRLNSANYLASEQRIRATIEFCRGMGLVITKDEEDRYFSDLQKNHHALLRAELAREEQARIKRELREELLQKQEFAEALEQKNREEALVKAALEKELAKVHGRHNVEIEILKARLAEIEEAKRAISQAQLTKMGHVYVISNIGSFGKDVYKVGMTRRLEPLDRVTELGDASVPFPFDVHMMIKCDDAPALENAMHRALRKKVINKVNLRKEFFRIDIESIRKLVAGYQGEFEITVDNLDAAALQYYESLNMPDDELERRENIFDTVQYVEEEAGIASEE